MKLSEAIKKYGDCEVKKELIELIDVKPKTIYDLKEGDKYFCLSSDGEIPVYTFVNNKFHKDCLSIGNAFLTKGEAEQYKEKLEVEAILRKYSYKFSKEEWKDYRKHKFCIRYNYDISAIEIICFSFANVQGAIFFENEEDTNQAIDEVGKYRLIKYLKAN